MFKALCQRPLRSLLSPAYHDSVANLTPFVSLRRFAQGKMEYASTEDLSKLRNIGISAHIDSGKTTTTERILYYTGRINSMHEVRGKDGVGAKMDSMELEREKGITIKSAATHTQWADGYHINIIDTPGHVDFTIEVERALHVLDGAIMLVCASSGVQSQTVTVDRQMKRYSVPRICFVNKCDRTGADHLRVLEDIRSELQLNAAFVQLPIGLEDAHCGVIDLLTEESVFFEGANGEEVRREAVSDDYLEQVREHRQKLLEALGDFDEDMELHVIEESTPSTGELKAAIRKGVLSKQFVPVFVGSAYRNKGVQTLLDGVVDYLPSPLDVAHTATDPTRKGEDGEDLVVSLSAGNKEPLLFLAFKLEENKFGQLTWVRVFQGTLRKGMSIVANNCPLTGAVSKRKIRLSRIVRLHSDELQDINQAQSGDIVAMFGVDCVSGTTFSDGRVPHVICSLHVPTPVVSIAVKPRSKTDMTSFGKAIERFQREDPTFKCRADDMTQECIFSGMGELHLDIYLERIRREYQVQCDVGKPRVSYRETITQRLAFDYLHKKQTGGRGQFARIIGYMEPIQELDSSSDWHFDFVNNVRGTGIPPQYIKSVRQGFEELCLRGPLVGGPIVGLRVVLEDGVTHEVDSSDFAFKNAAHGCFRKHLPDLGARVSEPYMDVELCVPQSSQSAVMGDLASRGVVINAVTYSGKNATIKCYAALDAMFGYATHLRSMTEGKGEFAMEYNNHQLVADATQQRLQQEYQELLETLAKN